MVSFGNTSNKLPFACPECGSREVDVRRNPRGDSILDKVRDMVTPGLPRGQVFLVCKKCGHVAMLHIQ